jgi:hypothetical protein
VGRVISSKPVENVSGKMFDQHAYDVERPSFIGKWKAITVKQQTHA